MQSEGEREREREREIERERERERESDHAVAFRWTGTQHDHVVMCLWEGNIVLIVCACPESRAFRTAHGTCGHRTLACSRSRLHFRLAVAVAVVCSVWQLLCVTPAKQLTKVLSLLPAGAYSNWVDFMTYGFFAVAVTSYGEEVPSCVQQILNAIDVANVDIGPQDAAVRIMSHWADYVALFLVCNMVLAYMPPQKARRPRTKYSHGSLILNLLHSEKSLWITKK